jgi:hypothetical protein
MVRAEAAGHRFPETLTQQDGLRSLSQPDDETNTLSELGKLVFEESDLRPDWGCRAAASPDFRHCDYDQTANISLVTNGAVRLPGTHARKEIYRSSPNQLFHNIGKASFVGSATIFLPNRFNRVQSRGAFGIVDNTAADTR